MLPAPAFTPPHTPPPPPPPIPPLRCWCPHLAGRTEGGLACISPSPQATGGVDRVGAQRSAAKVQFAYCRNVCIEVIFQDQSQKREKRTLSYPKSLPTVWTSSFMLFQK